MLSPEDVAVYGGLCALATLEREELKSRVVDSPAFKAFLELVPTVRTGTQIDRPTDTCRRTDKAGWSRQEAGCGPTRPKTDTGNTLSLVVVTSSSDSGC